MKKIYFIILMVFFVLLLTACGNDKSPADSINDSTTDGATASDTEEKDTEQKDAVEINQEDSGQEDVEESENVGIEEIKITKKDAYLSASFDVKLLGIESYDELGDGETLDKAGEGSEFLIVYLEIINDSLKDEYFNYNSIYTQLDGKDIETTFLINSPKNYPSIFDTIKVGTTHKGYIVYEVKKGWKELSIEYDGLEETRGINLTFDLSAEDVGEVEEMDKE